MIPLHVHTNYSLLESTIRIDELIDFAVKKSITSVAVTDTNAMYGLIPFAKKAVEAGIQPILGSYLDEPNNKYLYTIVLAKNNQGYKDLCKVITQRKLNSDFSIKHILKFKWKDLIFITPSIELLKDVNPLNSVYAEIIPTISNKNNALKTYHFAMENNIPIVASNPVYFLQKDDFEIHKLVTAIRLNKTIKTITNDDIVDEEFYFKDKSEIEKIFLKLPEAIANSYTIAQECKVDLGLGEYKYPLYKTKQNGDAALLLNTIAFEGLQKKI
jgi:DNA polymerase III alpha subunit